MSLIIACKYVKPKAYFVEKDMLLVWRQTLFGQSLEHHKFS